MTTQAMTESLSATFLHPVFRSARAERSMLRIAKEVTNPGGAYGPNPYSDDATPAMLIVLQDRLAAKMNANPMPNRLPPSKANSGVTPAGNKRPPTGEAAQDVRRAITRKWKTIAEIIEESGASKHYVHQLLSRMRKAGSVCGRRRQIEGQKAPIYEYRRS